MDSRQKTVMLYLNTLHRGGAERVFVQLAERFAGCGYKTILVTSFVDKVKGEYELSDNVTRLSIEQEQIIQSRLKRNVSRIKALRKLCKEYRPEILISCMQEPNFRAVLATPGLPVKNLVSVCNASEKEYPGLMGFVVGKILMPTAEGCVFQTEEEKAWFPKRLQNKSRIIMNQVNASFFDAEHCGERRDIVTVGRLTAQKNQALLIRAFARIAGETDDRLLIYGTGELRDELQELIDSLGLSGRAELMGSTDDVAGVTKDAKMFVLSSDYEGVPNALLEAMALGLPCVSTNCRGGGPAMVISSRENGLLVPTGDEEKLAEAMRFMLENKVEAERMGAAAKASAEDFRPEKVFSDWWEYAEKIMG